jgi:hypothetical protein
LANYVNYTGFSVTRQPFSKSDADSRLRPQAHGGVTNSRQFPEWQL